MEKSLVSVIIATYNREKYIKRAIESVLNQLYKNIELIIVDDGSIDGTKDIIKPYLADSRVHYIYQKNKGCVEARNNGIKIAKGKYIAILDSDDFWCNTEKIGEQVAFLERNKEYVLVGGGAIKIDGNCNEIIRYLLPASDADIRERILVSNMLAHVTILFRKDVWERVGGYDKAFDGLEDWDLFLKMGRVGKFYNIQEFFASYSGHQYDNPSYLDKKYGRLERLKLYMKIKKKYRDYYPNYKQSLLFCWVGFFYSFLPLNRNLWPLFFKAKNYYLFGRPNK